MLINYTAKPLTDRFGGEQQQAAYLLRLQQHLRPHTLVAKARQHGAYLLRLQQHLQQHQHLCSLKQQPHTRTHAPALSRSHMSSPSLALALSLSLSELRLQAAMEVRRLKLAREAFEVEEETLQHAAALQHCEQRLPKPCARQTCARPAALRID